MLRATPLEYKVADAVQPAIGQKGYNIVSVRWMEVGYRKILQVMIEHQDYSPITVDDCADASYVISSILDVEDFIADEYHLEVSSPGIDRPLVKAQDFDHYKGFEAKVTLGESLDGRKRFKGELLGIDGDKIKMRCLSEEKGSKESVEVLLPLESVTTAKLVLNDKLLAAANTNDYTLEETDSQE